MIDAALERWKLISGAVVGILAALWLIVGWAQDTARGAANGDEAHAHNRVQDRRIHDLEGDAARTNVALGKVIAKQDELAEQAEERAEQQTVLLQQILREVRNGRN
ncbi:hypothetical protein [Panacagrimonas sp.]|uniref:hypothetical protein n=1 Tax=Panacagrimonas sp. TaxID=2480088 RepID=UPI003B517180